MLSFKSCHTLGSDIELIIRYLYRLKTSENIRGTEMEHRSEMGWKHHVVLWCRAVYPTFIYLPSQQLPAQS